MAEIESESLRQVHQQGDTGRLPSRLQIADVAGRAAEPVSQIGLAPSQGRSAFLERLAEVHAQDSTGIFPVEMNNRDGASGSEYVRSTASTLETPTKRYPPLHEQLARVRKIADKTQDQIAEIVGWKKQSTVSNVERGVKDTQLSEAQRWAEACGYEIVLVPKGDVDPEGLRAMVDAVEDPAARDVIAALVRLTRRPHRYWMKFKDDFAYESRRAARDAADEGGSGS